MKEQTDYIRTDEHGAMRVGATHVMLDSVVAAFERGHSPETIRQQFPSLTLEQVYGAITYYLAHRSEVEEYLRSQDVHWARLRSGAADRNSPLTQRLSKVKQSAVEQNS